LSINTNLQPVLNPGSIPKTDFPYCGFISNNFFKLSLNVSIASISALWVNSFLISVSIALNKSSAGIIVKKINSLNHNNYLRKAFVEFNKIIASSFILEYINSEKFRTQIQIHLNRGEAFHKLKKAVFYADGGKIKGKSEHEQNVYQDSAMLLCSIIIYYNCRILSKLLLDKKISDEEREKVVKATPICLESCGYLW